MLLLFVLIEDVFPYQIYVYRQMVDIYIYVCMYGWTLLSIYMSKMSGRDYENLTTNLDCIYCQNFSMKTKFILGFIVLNYIRKKKLHTKY